MRPTRTFDILKAITPAIGKRIDAWTTADGVVGLFHSEDGNAYEVEIRPASLSKHREFDKFTKKRPMQEVAMAGRMNMRAFTEALQLMMVHLNDYYMEDPDNPVFDEEFWHYYKIVSDFLEDNEEMLRRL